MGWLARKDMNRNENAGRKTKYRVASRGKDETSDKR